MTKFILGRKGRMSQMFTETGEVVPVTILEVGPCYVTRVLSVDSDGYDAVQIGYEKTREKVLSKAEVGHAKKAGLEPLRHLREIRLSAPAELAAGQEIKADAFAVGDVVDVIGTTKGRGFSGGIKRHGFGGGPMTHGGMCRRFPGSSGAGSDPGRVFKGKRAPGHYGDARHTAKNLRVVAIDVENNLLVVKGAVPGATGGLVQVRPARTAKIKAGS